MSSQPAATRRPFLVKIVHGLIALSVAHQLGVSEFMSPPWEDHGGALESSLYHLHETVGLSITVLIAIFSAQQYRRQRSTESALFPWTDAGARSALFVQLRRLLRGLARMSLPLAAETSRVAAAIQGLGLLAVGFMATSGTAIWISSGRPELAESWAELHETGAVLVWAYVAGHAGMALLHELRGEQLLKRIFGNG